MGVNPGNKQTCAHRHRRVDRDRSDDPDIAETVLRFIPVSAAHEESAVSSPAPQKQLRCTVHPDYASRRRHWVRWC
jgi:hypothetical protein